MDQALSLAAQGGRAVLPNPCVGAVIVHRNEVIGAGFHEHFGGPHAEVRAIESVTNRELLRDSTLYVTLEPCSHFGKTPPCAELIIRSGIPRVVVACRDPFPAVSGRGIERLIEAGIEVIEDIRHDEAILLNKRFIVAHSHKRPYIVLKWAQTSDHFIAPASGERTTISSKQSHLMCHLWRGQEMAIAVGSKTAISDNPLLTVRHTELFSAAELPALNPLRVVIGEAGKLPGDLDMFYASGETVVFTSSSDLSWQAPSRVSLVELSRGQDILPQICRYLYERSMLSLFVEGGRETLQSFLDADLWDEARVFTSASSFGSGIAAPVLELEPRDISAQGGDRLEIFVNPRLTERLGLFEE
jgi:diaminohydroxyphosphoribosylaminopyrimidine deaminase/5-amino-6-(5-phosphoribosylamino)uracil reductase